MTNHYQQEESTKSNHENHIDWSTALMVTACAGAGVVALRMNPALHNSIKTTIIGLGGAAMTLGAIYYNNNQHGEHQHLDDSMCCSLCVVGKTVGVDVCECH